MGDIRKELKDRMANMEKEASSLHRQREEIDKKLQEIDAQWNALRVIFESETKRFGKTTIVVKPFAGMGVVEALRIIKAEQPNITRQQAHEILVKEGFDFRGKKSKRVVNFGWMALERSKK